MTRLDQALRWWRGHDGTPVPERHFKVLQTARCLFYDRHEGMYGLTNKGLALAFPDKSLTDTEAGA